MIAARIVAARKQKGYRQEDLAKAIGVSIDSVRRWEQGKRTPRFKDIEKIAVALRISVANLLGETDDPIRPQIPLKTAAQGIPSDTVRDERSKDESNLDTCLFANVYEYIKRRAHNSSLKDLQMAKTLLGESLTLLDDAIFAKSEGIEKREAP